jgi:hypothetical protein
MAGAHRAPRPKELPAFRPGREFDLDRWGDAILAVVILLLAFIGIVGLIVRLATI